ncbi:serine hydrolase FSH [Lophiotrema nucula]|uniref:Serine hydrolase FSH n=1 Tax=Lophiotrema nucula TaxID=690887 RepID=A0A6A5Z7W9_9PLEO|nr:serine hydrolase FSH [Lophiotrema nucula]
MTTSPYPSTTKPTILTFHGSGSNSTVHTVQLARLGRLLKPHFDLLTLEAPFPSAAGPGVLPFFEGCGPFKRWIPPSEKVSFDGIKKGEASGAMLKEVEDLIKQTVEDVRRKGGRVVGVVGFSQGTRVVAGLLKGSEIRKRLAGDGDGEGVNWCDFAFAVSVCGSYPPPLLPPSVSKLLDASSLSGEEKTRLQESRIESPTLHVLGKQDEWEWAGHLLIEGCYEKGEGKSEEVSFDMGHHYPVLPEDSELIRDWVMRTWERVEGGVEKR